MPKKLERGRGWFHRKTEDEVEIVDIWRPKKRPVYITIKYLKGQGVGDYNTFTQSRFLKIFRRKQDAQVEKDTD